MRTFCRLILASWLAIVAFGCEGSPASSHAADATSDTSQADGGKTGAIAGTSGTRDPSEWVAFRVEIPLPADYADLHAGLFGSAAQAGKFLTDKLLTDGYFVSSAADPAVPDQVRLTFAFDDESGKHRRKLAVVPASFPLARTWIATVDAAIAKMKADTAKAPGQGAQFLLEFRVVSTQGGSFTWAVRGDRGNFFLRVEASTPRTSLLQEKLGQALQSAAAVESIAGTVWFTMNKDDFDFFVDHAYGAGATSKQNFKDFQLVPHNWLRLSVEPHLDQQFVSVGFEVVGLDGKRLAIAKAPASVQAGSTFQALVDRNMANMLKQEDKQKGSSIPWQAPFYYDHPDGGGVVQVIAAGDKGVFSVAYAVESPQHALADVPFLPYEAVVFPAKDPKADLACDQLGDPTIQPAVQGTLDITFQASTVIRNSSNLKGPLVGTIFCSIFKANDVTVVGPNEGAQELESFSLPDADLTKAPKYTSKLLLAGDYQVLCYQDLDKDKTDSAGDPVTLPIGGQTVGCNRNPVVVEFSLLKP